MTSDQGTSQLAVYTEGTTLIIEGDEGGMARVSGENVLWLIQKLAKKTRGVS